MLPSPSLLCVYTGSESEKFKFRFKAYVAMLLVLVEKFKAYVAMLRCWCTSPDGLAAVVLEGWVGAPAAGRRV